METALTVLVLLVIYTLLSVVVGFGLAGMFRWLKRKNRNNVRRD